VASAASAQCDNSGIPLSGGGTTALRLAGNAGIPANASAVVLNVTATGTTAASFFTAYPGGARPDVSDLNWTAGETVPNLVVATVGAGGTVTVYSFDGSSDLVVDVLGWYQ
jgi:hypothetical protein